MANVNVKYKDSQNWTDLNGLITNWSSFADVYKDERVQPTYFAPEIITDVWNGRKHDVQHIRHDGWRLEFYGKESELQKLSEMQSCDIILIKDIQNGLDHTVDMQVSEWLVFNDPERISNTSNWRLVLEYRTNKKIINKFNGLDDQVTLIGSSTYNSKYEKLSYNGELEEIRVQWGEGGEKLLQETNNKGFKVLLYLSDSEKETFKNDWNQNVFTIDGTDIFRKLPLEITELGEDNFQVIISCITERETIDSTSILPVLFTLNGDFSHDCKFIKINEYISTEKIEVDWSDGTKRLLRETSKSGNRVMLYLQDAQKSVFYNDWNISEFTIAASLVTEKGQLEISELTSGYFQIIVPYVTATTVTTNDLTPLNTHTLVVTDSGTFTFYTDYSTEANVDDTSKDSFENEDGLPVDAKTIDKQVTNIKLFLNTSDKNSLKLHYERGTATIDATPILYRGIVDTTELGKDLWEVNISDITTTPVPNYPL